MKVRPLVPLAFCWLLLLLLCDAFSSSPKVQIPQDKVLFKAVVQSVEKKRDQVKVVVKDVIQESGERLGDLSLLKYPLEIQNIPQVGDRLRCFVRLKLPVRYKNPGTPDYRKPLAQQGIYLQGYVSQEDDCVVIEGAPSVVSLSSLSSYFQSRLMRKIENNFSPPARSFLKSLVLGDRSEMTPSDWDVFQKTGTTHLIAVSGLHLTLIGGFCYIIFSFVFRFSQTLLLSLSRRRVALLASLVPMMFYVLLLGFAPSAWRALVVASLVVLSFWIDREPDPWSLLSAAFLLLTFLNPSLVFGLSFQLSFLAMIGVLAFRSPGISQNWADKVKSALRMSLGASLLTFPLVMARFHYFSPTGLFHNLWAIPVVDFILVTALAILSLPQILSWNLLYKGLGWLCTFFLKLLEQASRYSWERTYFPDASESAMLIIGTLTLFLGIKIRSLRKEVVIIGSLLMLSLVGWKYHRQNNYEVCFIDVGQGDAAMIRSPSGKTVLIDGGGFLIPGAKKEKSFDIGEAVLLPYLKTKGVASLDQVILSHPHPDHFGGLKTVVDHIPIQKFCSNGQSFPDESFAELKKSFQEHRVSECTLKKGDSWDWEGLHWETLYPERVSTARSMNDNSLVLKMVQGDVSFLWTGDIEKEGEAALADDLGKALGVSATVLKIPHHGSKTSSSIPFIDTVSPQYVVASLGENNFFGFPHADILERYERRGAKVFRTDQDGETCFTWKAREARQLATVKTTGSRESPNSILSIQTFSSDK